MDAAQAFAKDGARETVIPTYMGLIKQIDDHVGRVLDMLEQSGQINDTMIETMLKARSMEVFKTSLATLTGGSGAVAVLVTDGSFSPTGRRRLLGGLIVLPRHGAHLFQCGGGLLQRRGLAFELHVWGPNQERAVAEVAARGLQDRVFLRGMFSPEQRWDAFAEFDVLIMATRDNEPYGRVIQEAAAAGAPSIAPDIAGIYA